jgi:hypothetical protein
MGFRLNKHFHPKSLPSGIFSFLHYQFVLLTKKSFGLMPSFLFLLHFAAPAGSGGRLL